MFHQKVHCRPKEKQVVDLQEQLQRYKRLFASSASRLPDGGRQLQAKIANLEKDIANAGLPSGEVKHVPTANAGAPSSQPQLPRRGDHQHVVNGIIPSRGPAQGQALSHTVTGQPAVRHQNQATVHPESWPAGLPDVMPTTSGEENEQLRQSGASALSSHEESNRSLAQAEDKGKDQEAGSRSAKHSSHGLHSRRGPLGGTLSREADSRVSLQHQQGLSDSAERVEKEASSSAPGTQEADDSSLANGRRRSPQRLNRQLERASAEASGKQTAVLSAALMTPLPDEHLKNQVMRMYFCHLNILPYTDMLPC